MLATRWREFIWSALIVYIIFVPLLFFLLHYTAGFYGAVIWAPLLLGLIAAHIALPWFGEFAFSFPFMVYPVAVFVIEGLVARYTIYTDPGIFAEDYCIYMTYLAVYLLYSAGVYYVKRRYQIGQE